VDVLTEDAVPADRGARLDVAEVPDLRSLADPARCVHVRALVDRDVRQRADSAPLRIVPHRSAAGEDRATASADRRVRGARGEGRALRSWYASSIAGRASSIPKPRPASVSS